MSRWIVKQTTFVVRTLMCIRLQMCLARALEIPAIDVCCIPDARSSKPQLNYETGKPIQSFHKVSTALFQVPQTATSDLAGVDVTLNERTEAVQFDWILLDSRQCAVKLGESYKANSRPSDRRNLSFRRTRLQIVVQMRSRTLYQKLHDLLRTAKQRNFVILKGDMNARVSRMSQNKKDPQISRGLNS